MKRLFAILIACVFAAGVLAGCASSDDASSLSASAPTSSAQEQSSSASEASTSSVSAASSDAKPAASSDSVALGSSDAVGKGSSDSVARGSSDSASSDAASSDSRSSEPVLDGPSGLAENDVAMQYVTCKEVLADIDKGDKTKLLVDLRKAEDFKAGHIKGAVNAPLNKVVDNNNYADGIANLTATLSRVTGNEVGEGCEIVLVCYAGKKYAQAGTDILNALGADMDTVFTLEGGMTAWNEAGNPVVTS
ncbi:MAG: hypothetical protein IJ131_05425 [Eggerthellaceae bacterium]|nr:hypothetical protein [Eggerthellaceae bacterium]